jgi:hypothetical protein
MMEARGSRRPPPRCVLPSHLRVALLVPPVRLTCVRNASCSKLSSCHDIARQRYCHWGVSGASGAYLSRSTRAWRMRAGASSRDLLPCRPDTRRVDGDVRAPAYGDFRRLKRLRLAEEAAGAAFAFWPRSPLPQDEPLLRAEASAAAAVENDEAGASVRACAAARVAEAEARDPAEQALEVQEVGLFMCVASTFAKNDTQKNTSSARSARCVRRAQRIAAGACRQNDCRAHLCATRSGGRLMRRT